MPAWCRHATAPPSLPRLPPPLLLQAPLTSRGCAWRAGPPPARAASRSRCRCMPSARRCSACPPAARVAERALSDGPGLRPPAQAGGVWRPFCQWSTAGTNVIRDAVPNVTCRQLGFGRGAEYDGCSGGRDQSAHMVGQLECQGAEAGLQDCDMLAQFLDEPCGSKSKDSEEWTVCAACQGGRRFAWLPPIVGRGMRGGTGKRVALSGSRGCPAVSSCSAQVCPRASPPLPPPAGAVVVDELRLANSSVPGEGRVEARVGSEWGTLCSAEPWQYERNDLLAAVVCRQLGFDASTPPLVRDSGVFGDGGLPSLADPLKCSGEEADLNDCILASPADHACHTPTFGVACNGEAACAAAGRLLALQQACAAAGRLLADCWPSG